MGCVRAVCCVLCARTSSLCGVVLSMMSMRKDVLALSEPTINRFCTAAAAAQRSG